MFAYFIKNKNLISHLHKYSEPLLSTLLTHLWQRLKPQVFWGITLHAWTSNMAPTDMATLLLAPQQFCSIFLLTILA
jgi:hypothetical protein